MRRLGVSLSAQVKQGGRESPHSEAPAAHFHASPGWALRRSGPAPDPGANKIPLGTWSLSRLHVALAAFLIFTPTPMPARQAADSSEELTIRWLTTGLREQGAYSTLKKLLSIGPRLTGSPQRMGSMSCRSGVYRLSLNRRQALLDGLTRLQCRGVFLKSRDARLENRDAPLDRWQMAPRVKTGVSVAG